MKEYNTGILFVHGIQGRPEQFNFLIEHVPDNVLVRNILLPGHGKTVKEFNRSDRKMWQDAVKAECTFLQQKCERVVFVGHSMGCLLGLIEQRESAFFSAMLLICCPFCIHPTKRYFANAYRANAKASRKDDRFVKAARQANSVFAKHAVTYLLCVKPYIELFKVMHNVKKQRIITPENTVFCYSGSDEIVGKKSVAYTRKHTNARIEINEGCGHNYFTEEAKERMAVLMEEMIRA